MTSDNKIIRRAKLRKYRELRNYTQEHMAEKLGVSPITYGRYEKGEYEPKMEQWEKIAEALEMPVAELLRSEPIVINMPHSQMVSNFGSQNNHHMPMEFFSKLTDQFEARIADLERTNQRFIDLIEGLLKKDQMH